MTALMPLPMKASASISVTAEGMVNWMVMAEVSRKAAAPIVVSASGNF
jgi:hypothetical protein